MSEQKTESPEEKIKNSLSEAKVELETLIKENPLAAAGVAALVGFLIGRLFNRRD